MPSITLNKKILEKLVGKKLPLNTLKDRISMLGTDLESIEGNEINVEIFPNRPDLLSEQGFARALSSFIGVKTGLRNYNLKKSGVKVIVDKSVSNVRPYTACAIVKKLKFDDDKIKEIIKIQEKLHITYGRNRQKAAIGVYPLEAINPPIRFCAKKPKDILFRPLEAMKEMTGLQILSRHPTGREYGHLLEGLSKFPIFVDSNNKVMSMPPIINSHDTGKISEKTKEVFIECSGFDFDVLSKCLNIIVCALADMGGDIYSVDVSYNGKKKVTPILKPQEMKIDLNYVNRILGLDLKEKDLKKYLERMGFGYYSKKVLIPPYRTDILHQVDLIEDIAIAYGYENFEEEIPNVSTIAHESDFESFKNKVANLLAGLGLLEVKTYTLTNKDLQTTRMNSNIDVIILANAKSIEHNCLRSWMIPSLLDVLKNNAHHEYPQDIFDVGHVFKKSKGSDTGVLESERLCVLRCNDEADYTKIKQVLDYLANALDISYDIEETDSSSFIKGRVGRIIVGNEKVAYMGEISPEVLSRWNLEMPVAALELNLTDLYTEYKKIKN